MERFAIDVVFDPRRSFLDAHVAILLVSEVSLNAIELELNPLLTIKSITDIDGRALQFDRSRRIGSPKLSVRLAKPSVPGESIRLLFAYEGKLPQGPLDYIADDGILLRDESRWYPSVDFSAFTENAMRVTLPEGWTAATNDENPDVDEGDQKVTFEWTTRPISSRALLAFPARTWNCTRDLVSESKPVLMVVMPSHCSQEPAPEFRSRLLEIETFFHRLIGDRPLHSRMTFGVGFRSARGAIGYSGPGFLAVSEDIPKYLYVPEYAPEFLPHEIAHQWFPIAVTIEREEDGWLAESIAEYLAWRYLQEKDPEAARRMVFSAMRDSLAPDPVRPLSLGLKLFALEPWSVTHATLYQRGMLVFRTLETVIDRERVDRALAEYYRRYHGRSASIADFRKICEEIAGRDLGWFFDYFLNGTRIPEIELRQVPSGAPGVAAGEIVVRNMPSDATVRVEMRIRTAKGAVEHSVATRGEVTPFSVNVPAPPLGIELDPDARILRWTEAARRHRAQQALLRQVGALEETGDITRARELCRQALALDPQDSALNQQQIRFLMGRLKLKLTIPKAQANEEFQAVLDGHSIDPVDTNFFRAWARVYRARIAKSSGRLTAVRAEVKAGLALLAPALDSRVIWSESHGRETSAREALLELEKGESKM